MHSEQYDNVHILYTGTNIIISTYTKYVIVYNVCENVHSDGSHLLQWCVYEIVKEVCKGQCGNLCAILFHLDNVK